VSLHLVNNPKKKGIQLLGSKSFFSCRQWRQAKGCPESLPCAITAMMMLAKLASATTSCHARGIKITTVPGNLFY
jgi:hypothetical protein